MTWSDLEAVILNEINSGLDKSKWDTGEIKDLVIAAGIAHDKAKDEAK